MLTIRHKVIITWATINERLRRLERLKQCVLKEEWGDSNHGSKDIRLPFKSSFRSRIKRYTRRSDMFGVCAPKHVTLKHSMSRNFVPQGERISGVAPQAGTHKCYILSRAILAHYWRTELVNAQINICS